MVMFHETAILPRNMVRAALQGGVNGTILPPAFQTADPARLADQIELIKIQPENLSIDDMSKLWTALQTHYRTTVGYLISVVLIERDAPKRTPLPVLSRGAIDPLTRRDAGVFVQPELTPATPTLTRVSPPGERPAMRLGDVLTFQGHHLDRGDAIVRFTEVDSGAVIELAPNAAPTPGRLQVELPQGAPLPAASPLAGTGADPGAWRIGLYLAEVTLQLGAQRRVTNRLPVTLAPRATPAAAAEAGGVRITVDCQPPHPRDPDRFHRRRPAGAAPARTRRRRRPGRRVVRRPALRDDPAGTPEGRRRRQPADRPRRPAAALRPDPTRGDAMNHVPMHDWAGANRRRLDAELEALGVALSGGEPSREAAADLDPPARLDSLAGLFGLGPVDTVVLLLAAAPELDGQALQGRRPTVSLALQLAGEGVWAAICPQSPLRRWRMIELEGSGPQPERGLKLDERILHHLLGVDYLDPRLDGLVASPRNAPSSPPAKPSSRTNSRPPGAAATPAGRCCRSADPAPEAKRAVAGALCAMRGQRLFRIARADVPHAACERLALARLCDREMALSTGVLLVEGDGAEEHDAGVAAFVDQLLGPTIVSGRDPLALERNPRRRVDMPPATIPERRELWRRALAAALREPRRAPRPARRAVHAGCTGRTGGGRSGHRSVTRRGSSAGCGTGRAPRPGGGWTISPSASRPRWAGTTWSCRPTAWQCCATSPSTCAAPIRCMASGAGRSAAAGAWASPPCSQARAAPARPWPPRCWPSELRLDLYRIDLSQVVSKYIGETEKNLRRIFEAAEQSGAILLFDEADALFGKRSEVKDSHDRYANVEVSYLLQRMEAYRGLAILTTNLKSSLDIAFMRRLRFVVDFPFPDMGMRGEIWRRIFPSDTPLAVDPGRLARLAVAGGTIRTIAINAAFLAAEAGEAVNLGHLAAAARREYAKLDKPITTAEFGGLT